MAGASKKRIAKLRAEGNHELADWVEKREVAKANGVRMHVWLRENPKPGTEAIESSHAAAIERKCEMRADSNAIPYSERGILEEIREKKNSVKAKALAAVKAGALDESKTLYKVLKRLDNEEKKIVFRWDFKAFDDAFFNDLQDRVPTADFHFDMVDLYRNNSRACVVCPRGHAKSTTARKYILHQILYGLTSYTIIVGASEDMAAQNLRWVRDQLTDNKLVLDIFGYLKNKDKWADTEFQTITGIKVSAKGAGQKIRGANEKGRPDLIYIDDLEEDEQVSSRDRRDKLRKWFTQALMPAKSRNGRVIITGTILHIDSLLRNISCNEVKDHMDWSVLFYQAISTDKNGNERALWEEHKPLKELHLLRNYDPETFAQEYQNEPTSGSMAVFNRDEFKYIESKDIRVDQVDKCVYVKGVPVNILITTDLALSEREGSDFTVFMVTGMDKDSNLYVLDYERFRTSDPYEQIDMIFTMTKRWHCDTVAMEQVAFQKAFKRMMEYEQEKRAHFFFIHELKRTNIKKFFRIKGLRGPIRAGKVMWQPEHFHIEDELTQVSATSLGINDDVIDCLSDAWDIQVEMIEENHKKTYDVNTIEWAIGEGLLPTAQEQLEMSMY